MKEVKKSGKKIPPGRTPEEHEMRCIALATKLAEEQLENGTASSQVITHYLKLGSPRAKYEAERMQLENELLKAKTENIKAETHADEMFSKAIAAMREYQGIEDE